MKLKTGTCSWNYDSWIGLVYKNKSNSAAAYLKQYSLKYNTAEIDSWFYRLPARKTVESYISQVPENFRFTCKVTNLLTMPFSRGRQSARNNDFLSIALFNEYLEAINPMLKQIDAIIFEFEYLNRNKVSSLKEFIEYVNQFIQQIPEGLPVALETRNKNYLGKEYFEFLRAYDITHVFSEKLYMPHVYEVYDQYRELLGTKSVIRLLGGDRKEIEDKTHHEWNRIVEPRDDLPLIADMVNNMLGRGIDVTLNVNNHFEGSAPLTIDRLRDYLK